MDKKLIFFDVDGTLISYKNETHIPNETKNTIDLLKRNGHIVAIATAKCLLLAEQVMDELNIEFAVLNNGARIVCNSKIIYEKTMAKIATKNICKYLINTKPNVFAFGRDNIYVHNISDVLLQFVKMQTNKNDILKPLNTCNDSLFSINIYGKNNNIEEFLNSFKSIIYDRDQFEIRAKGTSKSCAVKRLAKILNIDKSNIIAVGDGKNDIGMLKEANIGIAVGNACKELKDIANIVTDDIENGGIYKVFKDLNLIGNGVKNMQKGLVHLYFGDGKGKTTAAIGLGLRAYGRGKKVLLVQFLKDFNSGEILALENLKNGFNILKCEPVKKFFFSMSEEEKNITISNQHKMFLNATQIVKDNIDLVIFDELVDAVNLGIISKSEIEDFLNSKPENLEIVITGHNPDNDFLKLCDYISEIKKIKHPYDNGTKARMGIEK